MNTKFALLALCAIVEPRASAHAQATSGQLNDEQSMQISQRKALGSRVGDREIVPNAEAADPDRRALRRIDTRLNLRINSRIDRFATPETNYNWRYVPNSDDGTKIGASLSGKTTIFGTGMSNPSETIGTGLPVPEQPADTDTTSKP